MKPFYKAIKLRVILQELKQASVKKETNHELTKDDEVMVVLTQKSENESLGKNIFRVTGGNERSFTLIKPQGNDRVTARSLPPNFVVCWGKKKDISTVLHLNTPKKSAKSDEYIPGKICYPQNGKETDRMLSFHRPLLFKLP